MVLRPRTRHDTEVNERGGGEADEPETDKGPQRIEFLQRVINLLVQNLFLIDLFSHDMYGTYLR